MKVEPGAIFWVRLDPTVATEKNKKRPCLVLTPTSKLGLATVVPITDAGGVRPSSIFVPIKDWKGCGLDKPAMIDTWQMRCLHVSRFDGAQVGVVGDEVMDEVKKRLANILGIDEQHLD